MSWSGGWEVCFGTREYSRQDSGLFRGKDVGSITGQVRSGRFELWIQLSLV